MKNDDKFQVSLEHSPLLLSQLPTEIILDIASNLKPTELVPLLKVSKQFHGLITPVLWGHIGFTQEGYRPSSRHFKWTPSGSTYIHASPSVAVSTALKDPVKLDNLTFLLMANNISSFALSCIKTVTLCSSYEFCPKVDYPGLVEAYQALAFTKNSQSAYSNKLAAIDLAIIAIYESWPKWNPVQYEKLRSLFDSTGDLDLFEECIEAASVTLSKTSKFESNFLDRQYLLVGASSSASNVQKDNDTRILARPVYKNQEHSYDLVLNSIKFSDIMGRSLLTPTLVTNLSLITIDVGVGFSSLCDSDPRDHAAFQSSVVYERLDSVLVNMPNVKLALNINIADIVSYYYLTQTIIDRLIVLRAVIFERPEMFLSFGQLLEGLIQPTSSRLEKLDLVTMSTGSNSFWNAGCDHLLHAHLEPLLQLPSFTTLRLSSSALMETFIDSLLPTIEIPVLELKFSKSMVMAGWLEALFTLKLKGTTSLRVHSKFRTYHLPESWDIQASSLQEFSLKNITLPASTKASVYKRNPLLKKIVIIV